MRGIALLVVAMACDPSPPGVEILDAPPPLPCAVASSCNPFVQVGCSEGQKCTWIADDDPVHGNVTCWPDGEIRIGESCLAPSVGAGDDCVRGALCVDGTCKAICDIGGGAPVCDPQHVCAATDAFNMCGRSPLAGVCVEAGV